MKNANIINLENFKIPVFACDIEQRIIAENHFIREINNCSFIGETINHINELLCNNYKIKEVFSIENITVYALREITAAKGIIQIQHELINPLENLRSRLTYLSLPKKEMAFFNRNLISIQQKIHSITQVMEYQDEVASSHLYIVDLARTVSNVSQAVNSHYKNPFVIPKIESNFPLLIDESKIILALLHLIGNAIKMRKEAQSPEIIITLAEEKKKIILSVSDNGVGFSTVNTNELTHPYQQSDDIFTKTVPGLGNGLYFVKKIMDSHKGTISLENNEQGGGLVKLIFNQIPNSICINFERPRVPSANINEIKAYVSSLFADITF